MYSIYRALSDRREIEYLAGERLDELRNRGITIVLRFTARKNHLGPRRASGENYLSFGLNVTSGESPRAGLGLISQERRQWTFMSMIARGRRIITLHTGPRRRPTAKAPLRGNVLSRLTREIDEHIVRLVYRILEPNNNIRNCPLINELNSVILR